MVRSLMRPMERTMSQLLFVYGTLKRGYGNYLRFLKEARFLGEAVSVDMDYVMTGADASFPMLYSARKHASSGLAFGEVFEVTNEQLQNCDRLEHHPNWYRREQRKFVVGNKVVTAWVYIMRRDRGAGLPATERYLGQCGPAQIDGPAAQCWNYKWEDEDEIEEDEIETAQ